MQALLGEVPGWGTTHQNVLETTRESSKGLYSVTDSTDRHTHTYIERVFYGTYRHIYLYGGMCGPYRYRNMGAFNLTRTTGCGKAFCLKSLPCSLPYSSPKALRRLCTIAYSTRTPGGGRGKIIR